MPVQPTFPGVYIEEIPSGVRTISGVATSITAFVGHTARGVENQAVRIFSFADFDRAFGGLAANSELSYAVQQFFDNGGSDAYVVRVTSTDAAAAIITLHSGNPPADPGNKSLKLTARAKGAWANRVIADVDYDGVPSGDPKAFNLVITDLATGTVETFGNVTTDTSKPNDVVKILNDSDKGSKLVAASEPGTRPTSTGTTGNDIAFPFLADKIYRFKFSISTKSASTSITNEPVTLLEKTDARPDNAEALSQLFERKLNAVLNGKLPGAAVVCQVIATSSGKALRIRAFLPPDRFPDALDATITFAEPDNGTDVADARPILGLKDLADSKVNVARYWLGGRSNVGSQGAITLGSDGAKLPGAIDLVGKEVDFSGIYALRKVDLFNILCIPDATRAKATDPNALDDGLDPIFVFSKALNLCLEKRAFLLVDPPPEVDTPAEAIVFKTSQLTALRSPNAAVYFPRVKAPDPLKNLALRTFAPCGVVAGCFSRTDATRGVWKAPAGIDVSLRDVQSLVYKLTDAENGALNILGVNCFRTFPAFGNIVWGARTLVGSNEEGSESKYVPVRRLTLFIEESLFRGTQFVVFEPNDETLWAQIRLNVGAFMNDLFRQGAFQGKSQRDAFSVRCDSTTTTQSDINNGIVNIIVGFAPLKPAEFVFIKIQQLAGQLLV